MAGAVAHLSGEKRHSVSPPNGYSYARFHDQVIAFKDDILTRLMAAIAWIYQRTIVELILRRKHIEASKDGRHIPLRIDNDAPLIDTRRGHSYVSNNIRTSRYTVWDFIPKQLFFQFSRVGNFYFLCVGIPQMIPGLSTTGSYTTILPLLFFVCVTIAKEGFDDYRRYRLDVVENANFATVLGKVDKYSGKSENQSLLARWNPFKSDKATQPWPKPKESFAGLQWVPTRWGDIKVGDVLRLCRDEPVPADMVLLYSDGENGLAYIETMALDGETNLKSKQVCHALEGCDTIEGISRCVAEFVVEDPNPELFSFDGRVTVHGQTVPLTLNEVLYRGSILRNTEYAIGVVINTGEECKIRMNANRHPKAKRPLLERMNNKIVVTLAIYVVILSVGVSMGYVQWQKDYERHAWYLDQSEVPFYQIIIAFIIMFNNVVPLSLYITLEIVKVGQLLMLNSDLEMYDEETDTPARCNTNTILENLGQVGYIFSDKTGTLTDNIMKFRKISVAGTVWLHEMDLEVPASDEMASMEEVTSSDISIYKAQPDKMVSHAERPISIEIPISPSRPSMGRRSSSHWQSTGRPDHVQPELNTEDMLEYIRLRPHSPFARKAKEYLLAMALCHTCLPEKRDGKLEFQASSPDELALVKASKELGYTVVHRNSQSLTLQLDQPDGQGEKLTFQVLDVIEFSSARKRMSIVIRFPDGRISVICKGADSAILPRLKMSSLAIQKAAEVRQSADLEHQMYRNSEHRDVRNSFVGRSSLTVRRNPAVSTDRKRPESLRSKSFEASRVMRRSEDRPRLSITVRGLSFDGRHKQNTSPYLSPPAQSPAPMPGRFDFVEDSSSMSESEVFTKCFQHLEEFATEGLRTLLYAQRFISEADYRVWKTDYDEATTSLTDRQERIEAAAEKIEQSFNLVGATAIEDKLQKGVPETIDRLRKANIRIWMLTGDKRETAINIAHSARICRPGSDIYILDVTKGSLESQLEELNEDLSHGSLHSVVVIDGATLATVEKSTDLSARFFAVMVLVDSVICCRASPAQKALLVKAVRTSLRSLKAKDKRGLTLAIGDGANDLAMISASHVGIGISGKEGLQAARVADYSIAQFRYLQRLLLVHGRWNYVRTAKFILCTFWKEMFFYLPQAQYQRFNGYTGTSLYEATSLTVFNTLFTSLCTICMGIWEQDLQAETLLAVPELYVYGQRNMGLNFWNYIRWMFHAACQGVITWYGVWAGYGWIVPSGRDNTLYALGQNAFTVGVLWVNWKLFIFETHYKTTIVMWSFLITTGGWFAWNGFLSGVYAPSPSGPYAIRGTFTDTFGADATWWATVFGVLSVLGLMDMVLMMVKRNLRIVGMLNWPPWKRGPWVGDGTSSPGDLDMKVWQELEQDPLMWERIKKLARDESDDDDFSDAEEPTVIEMTTQDGGSSLKILQRIRRMIPFKI